MCLKQKQSVTDWQIDRLTKLSLCFAGATKMAFLASDWPRHFRILLRNRWTGFDEKISASTQHPLPSLYFSGQFVNKDGHNSLWLAETWSTSLPQLLKGSWRIWHKESTEQTLPSLCLSAGPSTKMSVLASKWPSYFRPPLQQLCEFWWNWYSSSMLKDNYRKILHKKSNCMMHVFFSDVIASDSNKEWYASRTH